MVSLVYSKFIRMKYVYNLMIVRLYMVGYAGEYRVRVTKMMQEREFMRCLPASQSEIDVKECKT